MSSSFRKSFLTHLLIGGVIGILYFIFSHSSFFMNRLINSLFLASFFSPYLWRSPIVKNLGTFDLFIYSHRKLWKYGKHHEKFEEENEKIAPASTPELGSYYEYRNSRNVFPSCAGPVLAGSYISFCRCFWHSVPCRKLCIFLCLMNYQQFMRIIIVLNSFLHSL